MTDVVSMEFPVKEVVVLPHNHNWVTASIRADQRHLLTNTENLWAAPGLVDIHTHVFPGHAAIGSIADDVGVHKGVSIVVDAGSSGWQNFEQFMVQVIHPSVTTVYAWLNISPDGLVKEKGELADLDRLSLEKTVETARRHSRYIKGIKARASATATGNTGIAAIRLAKAAAEVADVPLMVHIGNGPPSLEEVLALLSAGDIITHCFHGKPGGILEADGRLRQDVDAARARGILFDVGHGSASLDFSVAGQAIANGFLPDTISTDVYDRNVNGPVFDLVTTINKFIALGMGKAAALEAASLKPSSVLGLSPQELSTGLTLLEWQDAVREYVDSQGNVLKATGAFAVKYILANGSLIAL